MAAPSEFQQAARQLSEIWQTGRHERVTLDGTELQRENFLKKMHVWYAQKQYVDPRDGQVKRIAFVFVPKRLGLGSDLATYIKDRFCDEVDHLVVVRSNESKTPAQIFDEADVVWETIDYDEIAFNKFKCAGVPRYTIIHNEEERTAALREMDVYKEEDMDHIWKIGFRTDPMARLLGLRLGDLVRVVSNNANTGIEVKYRYTVKECI